MAIFVDVGVISYFTLHSVIHVFTTESQRFKSFKRCYNIQGARTSVVVSSGCKCPLLTVFLIADFHAFLGIVEVIYGRVIDRFP